MKVFQLFAILSLTGASCATAAVTVSNLLALYDYNGDANDRSGNAPNSTLTSGAVISADGAGYSGAAGDSSLDVNAASAHGLTTGLDVSSAIANNSMAVSFWQYNRGNGNGGASQSSVFGILGTGAEARGFGGHTTWSNGIVYFDHSGCCAPNQRLTVGGVGNSLVDSWNHIVFQVDNGTSEIWINGVLSAEATSGAAPVAASLTGEVRVGQQFDGTVDFDGRLDEFAIWDVALEASEIQALAGGAATQSIISTGPADADNDGLLDSWERSFGLSPSDDGSVDINNGPDGDPDDDGLTNLEEFNARLRPDDNDFDQDGILDGAESNTGTYVDSTDTGTDPKNADTDGDGLNDGVEDPTLPFADASQPGTDPTKSDTDGDSYADLLEIDNGSDPTDPDSTLGTDELTLLTYFNFDGQLADQSGNTPDAVLGGTAVLTTTGMGTTGTPGDEAIELGAINDGAYAQTPAGTHLDQAFINQSMSVTFWQYNTAVGNSNAFWLHSPSATGNGRGFQAHTPWSNGTVYFDQGGCCNPPQRLTTTGAVTGAWQHFVFQRDKFAERQIWIDGVLVASAGEAGPLTAFDGVITIGAEGPTLNNSFAGRIDDFAIFANTLSPEQIAELATGANPPDLISPPVPFIITAIDRNDADGRTTITWNSRTNRAYAVDSSDDLDIWTEITDSVESQGEATTFTDILTTGTLRRFYRIREVE